DDSAQALPCRLVQGRIRAHQVANHVPGSNVKCPFGRRTHCQRNRTLRTKAYPLGRRFLPRLDAHGLREHVYRHGFMPGFELSIAAKTIQIFHGTLPGGQLQPKENTVSPSRATQVCRKIPAGNEVESPPALTRPREGVVTRRTSICCFRSCLSMFSEFAEPFHQCDNEVMPKNFITALNLL